MDIIILQTVLDQLNGSYRAMGGHQLAWYLRKFDYKVQVVNFVHQLSIEQIFNILNKYITNDTKILGLGGILFENKNYFNHLNEIIKLAKDKYPNLKIIAGGPSVHVMSNRLSKEYIDYFIYGHAENTMLQFCNWLFRGQEKPIIEISASGQKHIKETSFTGSNGFEIENCNYRWDDSDMIQPSEVLPLETSRGCIFKCKFCQYPLIGKHKKDFLKSMDHIREELIDNYERFGTTSYYILDDTWNADTERLEEFANMVAKLSFKIKYATYLRLDLIEAHRHTEDLLLESGLYGAFFGIESFNPVASALVGKSFSGKKAKEYLPYLLHDKWKGQVKEHLGLIVGLPPEKYADVYETFLWCVNNKIRSWRFAPLILNSPDTAAFTSEFERNADKYGFTLVKNVHSVRGSWTHSNGTTYEDAYRWGEVLHVNSLPRIKKGGWTAVQALQYGYSLEEIDTRFSIEYKDWYLRINLFLNQYYNKLMTS